MLDWAHLPITPAHVEFLEAHAVTADAADTFGIRSLTDVDDLPEGFEWAGHRAVPAIVFPWYDRRGDEHLQIKPDTPVEVEGEKRPRKYLMAKGAGSVLGEMREPDEGADTILIVEGTKQALCAWAYSSAVGVYAVAGCRNWSEDGLPSLDLLVARDKRVVVIFDGDLYTNVNVWEAGRRLVEALKVEGADEILFANLPAGKDMSLDDVLGIREPDERIGYLSRLLELAKPLSDKAPSRPTGLGTVTVNPYIDPKKGGLQAKTVAKAVLDRAPAALTAEMDVAVYTNGVFHIDHDIGFEAQVVDLLDEHSRPGHATAVEQVVRTMLWRQGLVLPSHAQDQMLNVRNGMLDLATGTLKPHDPEYLSTIQYPVEYDPDAECPVYEAWLQQVIPGQIDDLEETISQMLDPSRTPSKALFAYGPSRSGKSTILRLMADMCGEHNTSAVNLHQLSTDSFASANVFGKSLNAASDMSAQHVDDLSVFKQMTGEDRITGNRKYGKQFTFINRALFAFSANELPTVSESSRAYSERIKPFAFKHSFAGRENPDLEKALLSELPGILNRWLAAWQRRTQRGHWLTTDDEVATEFETSSDRVRQWVSEACVIVDGPAVSGSKTAGTTKAELGRAFNAWASENGSPKMQPRKINQRLTSINGVREVRFGENDTRGLNIRAKSEAEMEADSPAIPAVLGHSSYLRVGTSPSDLSELVNESLGSQKLTGASYSPKLPELPEISPSGLARFTRGNV